MSTAASNGNGDMIAHDLGCNHGQCLTLGGVHLAFKKTAKERNHIKHTCGFKYEFKIRFYIK